jgi:hypothetical protein
MTRIACRLLAAVVVAPVLYELHFLLAEKLNPELGVILTAWTALVVLVILLGCKRETHGTWAGVRRR